MGGEEVTRDNEKVRTNMCQFRSALVGIDGTITFADILGDQSHTKIRESIGYVDDKLPPDQVPVECRPIGETITSTDPADWGVYDDLPDNELPEWYKRHQAELHAAVIEQHIRDVAKVTEWKFNDNLYLWHCERLKSLPEELMVEGDLSLFDCPEFGPLPGGLRVGGNLDFWYCPSIMGLSDDLKVEGEIFEL